MNKKALAEHLAKDHFIENLLIPNIQMSMVALRFRHKASHEEHPRKFGTYESAHGKKPQ
jgi:hypothetical protein